MYCVGVYANLGSSRVLGELGQLPGCGEETDGQTSGRAAGSRQQTAGDCILGRVVVRVQTV